MSLLRPATDEDAPRIAHIHRIARAQAMPWLPIIHTAREDLDYFSDIVLPKQTVRIALENEEVAGFSAYAEGWLNHLYIHPDFWRKGLGKLLLKDAQSNNDALQLWTFQDNMAAQDSISLLVFASSKKQTGKTTKKRPPDVRLVWARSE